MATRRPKTVLYRRKRENKTNYARRLKLLLSRRKRLVVRFSNQNIVAQLIEFTTSGDKVLVSVNSSSLKKFGWNYSNKNLPAAYLTGLLLGKEASKKGYKEAILDTGNKAPLHKGRVYAFLKGALDSGLQVPHGEGADIFPSEERLTGKHISEYAKKIKENKEVYEKKFAHYLKSNIEPEKIVDLFGKVKEKLSS